MKEKLYLIDGHALIFKMYYAFLRRPMINSKGEDMSILFGFTKYILELISREKPEYLAVAFDPPGGTFRNQMYPEYKANRTATPQLVIDALEPLMKICKALGITTLMMPGFEADDVIGSMAKKQAAAGLQVYMVTPDKDYGQLIDDDIFQIKPGKAGGEDDVKAICEKYGISSPSQVIEMLTICGDTADNVPGVKGVGEVGAGKLIAKYGTVKNIYEHISELSARQQVMFREAEQHIGLSHDLVTIKTDIDLPEEDMHVALAFTPEVAELFSHYEFNSLRKLIPDASGAGLQTKNVQSAELKIEEVSAAEISELAGSKGAVGIVTDAYEPGIFGEAAGIAVAVEDGELSAKVAFGAPSEFKSLLENEDIKKYGYDLKLQMLLLENESIDLKGNLLDNSLMHYLLNPETSHRQEMLAKTFLGIDLEKEEEAEAPASLFDTPADEDGKVARRYASAAVLTGIAIRKELEKAGLDKLYSEMEEPLMRVLAKMERDGVKVDLAQIEDFADSLRRETAALEAEIRELADEPSLNISSPKQVGDVLFDKLKLDPKAKKSGRGSYTTDEATLTAIIDKHPVVGKILEYRAVKKLLSTYIEPFPSYVSSIDGRVHTTFNQALTATGRLSSSAPNLQNIPVRTERGREIRKAFVPGTADGVIVSADYSQIELRIMAHLSQDKHLVEAFRNGIDIHSATAEKIFGVAHEEVTPDQRRVAKTANFGIMYGISSFGLAQRLGISRTEAKKLIDDYFAAFNSKNATVRALAERNAVNAPIQGTAADIIKMAMINVDRKLTEASLKSKMVLQIHDELLFDVPEEETRTLMNVVKDCMENVMELSVPLTVECNYGKNWLEAH